MSTPARFEVADIPGNGTVQFDERGVARVGLRFFYEPGSRQQLVVSIHQPPEGEFEQYLDDFATHEGTLIRMETIKPFQQVIGLDPKNPDQAGSTRSLVGVLANGQQVYVIGNLEWAELTTVLASIEGQPGSLTPQTFGDLTPSGVGVESDELLLEEGDR